MEELTAWEKVLKAREAKRPKTQDYINEIFEDFMEFHGDRLFGDDKSIIAGIAKLPLGKEKFQQAPNIAKEENNDLEKRSYIPVTIIGQEKGKTTSEKMERNFGMPNPEGYRKALRLMKQAEKFGRPIITFIDTPGAYPGIGAEERGQGEAIARNLLEMSRIAVPIISIVIGEGSSGGALAIGVGDRIVMLENSVYSILSPEGFASILYKDASKNKEAAENMKLTADELKKLNIIDKIIKEDTEFKNTAGSLREYLLNEIENLKKLNKEDLLSLRYEKYRKM